MLHNLNLVAKDVENRKHLPLAVLSILSCYLRTCTASSPLRCFYQDTNWKRTAAQPNFLSFSSPLLCTTTVLPTQPVPFNSTPNQTSNTVQRSNAWRRRLGLLRWCIRRNREFPHTHPASVSSYNFHKRCSSSTASTASTASQNNRSGQRTV